MIIVSNLSKLFKVRMIMFLSFHTQYIQIVLLDMGVGGVDGILHFTAIMLIVVSHVSLVSLLLDDNGNGDGDDTDGDEEEGKETKEVLVDGLGGRGDWGRGGGGLRSGIGTRESGQMDSVADEFSTGEGNKGDTIVGEVSVGINVSASGGLSVVVSTSDVDGDSEGLGEVGDGYLGTILVADFEGGSVTNTGTESGGEFSCSDDETGEGSNCGRKVGHDNRSTARNDWGSKGGEMGVSGDGISFYNAPIERAVLVGRNASRTSAHWGSSSTISSTLDGGGSNVVGSFGSSVGVTIGCNQVKTSFASIFISGLIEIGEHLGNNVVLVIGGSSVDSGGSIVENTEGSITDGSRDFTTTIDEGIDLVIQGSVDSSLNLGVLTEGGNIFKVGNVNIGQNSFEFSGIDVSTSEGST